MAKQQTSRPSRTAAGGTRERMVAGAADLLRRRGVAATSLREVVRHTGTPRGSIGHHFPHGKGELLAEAVDHARRHVSQPLRHSLETRGVVDGLRAFSAHWRRTLESTQFEAGCPVMAVAIELDPDGTDARSQAQQRLLDLAQAAFDEWAGLMADALRREGVPAERARRVATLVIASFEGAIALARAARDARPLDEVARELEAVVAGALPAVPRESRRARTR